MIYTPAEEWIRILHREYLQDFIRHGGSAVKFVVPSGQTDSAHLIQQIKDISKVEGYQFVFASAAQTKIHLIDRLFHKVSEQIDWNLLSQKFLKHVLEENGYKSPDLNQLNLKNISTMNEREEKFLLNDIEKWLEKEIYRDYEMNQEFRIAMRNLCLAELDSANGVESYSGLTIKEWLQGKLSRISVLKNDLIFQKIARHNARHMLFSLVHWLRRNQFSGLVMALDISQYLIRKHSKIGDDVLYHSTSATIDAYEVLRQFIDGTDEVDGFLAIVIAPMEFLNDDTRGLNKYQALKLRIFDEVRDAQRQNPLGNLIRVSAD
jgi:hypothetical protein